MFVVDKACSIVARSLEKPFNTLEMLIKKSLQSTWICEASFAWEVALKALYIWSVNSSGKYGARWLYMVANFEKVSTIPSRFVECYQG